MKPGRAPVPNVPRDAVLGRSRGMRSSAGVLRADMGRALEEFHSLPSDDARAAFADKWLSLAAQRLEHVWPMVYELLRIVRERDLWSNANVLEGQRAFASFADYFEARTGKTFGTWVDLEQTYTYCCTFRPELIERLYTTAKQARVAEENKKAGEVKVRAHRRPTTAEIETIKLDANKKDVKLYKWDGGGNTSSYAMRRLAKDRPDLHARCLAGELTAHAAMVEAGFRKRAPSRKKTPLERLGLLWNQIPSAARIRFLSETLTPDERQALQYAREGYTPLQYMSQMKLV